MKTQEQKLAPAEQAALDAYRRRIGVLQAVEQEGEADEVFQPTRYEMKFKCGRCDYYIHTVDEIEPGMGLCVWCAHYWEQQLDNGIRQYQERESWKNPNAKE